MYLKAAWPQLKKFGLPDLFVISFILAAIYALFYLGISWRESSMPAMAINLEFSSLPRYAAFSLARAFAALLLSLVFSLVYGTWAAYKPQAERWLIPILDILQCVPVVGFLPGLAIAMMALFPKSRLGLEFISILMIFSSQAWNITFSIYYSIKQTPPVLKDIAHVYRLGPLRRFLFAELPYGMIPMVWNSMLSMAGGWFFLMICESFAIKGKDFRLPGIGSYMSVAISQGDKKAIVAGILTMLGLILGLEILLWRPLLSWASRFKWEELQTRGASEVFFYRLLKRSRFVDKVMDIFLSLLTRLIDFFDAKRENLQRKSKGILTKVLGIVLGVAFVLLCLLGSWKLFLLLFSLSLKTWGVVLGETFLTAVRVFAAVLLASLWTIPLGAAIGFFPRLTRIAQPFVQIGAAFPTPMIFPLILIALQRIGIGLEISSSLLLMLAVQGYLLFNIIAGASSLPQTLKEVSITYKLPWVLWVKRVVFPILFPFLVTGWTTAAGGAWNASIVAEYVPYKGDVFVTRGLGALMIQAAEKSDAPMLAATLVVMIVVVVGLNRTFWKKLSALAETHYSLTE